jgi:predicted DNA-binding protein with PD1-like motif
MKSIRSAKEITVRLEIGEELNQSLLQLASEFEGKFATFSAIGAVSHLTLGYYTLSEKAYHWKEFSGEYEILGITGNISLLDGKPFVHMHGVFSGSDFAAFGGHIKDAVIGASCEIILSIHDTPLSRAFDDASGLKLWEMEG